MIDQHFLALQETGSRYRGIPNRTYIEANMSFIDTDRIAKRIHANPRFGKVEVVKFHTDNRFGVWTSKDKKDKYVWDLRRTIPHTQYAEDYMSLNEKDGHKPELIKQLKQFRREVGVPKNGEAGKQLHYTVSYTGKSPGKKDDFVMALGILFTHTWWDVYQNDDLIDLAQRGGRPLLMG